VRAVIQRVKSANVSIGNEPVASIGLGLVVLLGIEADDSGEDLEWLAGKLVGQRLFPDGAGSAWSRSVIEAKGEILLVSQFTLHASIRKGTKPSWHRAAKPEQAASIYEAMVERLGELTHKSIATGRFGAMMDVALVNDGPVTLFIDSKARE